MPTGISAVRRSITRMLSTVLEQKMPSSFATGGTLFQAGLCEQHFARRRTVNFKYRKFCFAAVIAVVFFGCLYSSNCCPRRTGSSTSSLVRAPSLTYPPLNDVIRIRSADHRDERGRRRFVKNCTKNALSVPLIPAETSRNEFTRIIHRTWRTAEVPTKWKDGETSCRKANPTYHYCHWTDAELESFIGIEYPWFLETYRGYMYDIQRVDAARYFLVYHYGGVYIDLDLACRQSFDEMLSIDVARRPEVVDDVAKDIILVETLPVGVTNEFLATRRPRDPFMREVIGGLRSASSTWYVISYPTIIYSTGPMYLSKCLWRLEAQADAAVTTMTATGNATRVHIIQRFRFEHKYFEHLLGSSWHQWDGLVITFFFRNRSIFKVLAVVATLVISGVVGVFVFRRTTKYFKKLTVATRNA